MWEALFTKPRSSPHRSLERTGPLGGPQLRHTGLLVVGCQDPCPSTVGQEEVPSPRTGHHTSSCLSLGSRASNEARAREIDSHLCN